MKTVAWGEKTGLRPFEEGLTDAEIGVVYGWSRDQEILQWSGGAPVELTLPEFRERIRRESQHPPIDRRMYFIVTLTGEIIGRTGCFGLEPGSTVGELGIVIGERAFWGMGYGRDAVTVLLRHIFETTPLLRINLYTYPENLRAQKCFIACGFRPLGSGLRFSSDLGEFEGIEMEITRDEFFARSHLPSHKIPLPQGQT